MEDPSADPVKPLYSEKLRGFEHANCTTAGCRVRASVSTGRFSYGRGQWWLEVKCPEHGCYWARKDEWFPLIVEALDESSADDD
jgi:hypothetical protein